jgi:hypothetical protein
MNDRPSRQAQPPLPPFGEGVPLAFEARVSAADAASHRLPATPTDVITTLRHFAIVTYAVPPDRLAGVVDRRFELEMVSIDGEERAPISVVPFEAEDFRWAASDGPRWRFGQTN